MADRDDGDIDIRGFVALLWRGRYWLAGFVLLFGGLAAAHAFLSQPVYRSDALMAVRSAESGAAGALQGQLGGLASLVGINLGGGSDRRQEFVAYLKSRALAKEFVERKGLMQVFYASAWNETTKQFESDGGRPPTIGDAIDYLSALRGVEENARTGLLTVSFYWTDPVVAASWVNDYVALANEKLRQEAIEDGHKSIEYLKEELGRTTIEPVRQSLFRLMEGRLNQVMLASIEPQYAFRVIDRAEAPERDKFVRPRRVVEIVIGILFGGVLGTVFVLWRYVGSARGGA
jgi:LPS O-antigen subunit length determinant protein (WzzB/FepE family)